MNGQKIKQGDFGYISHKKKTEILKTIVFFAIPLSLYIAGYVTTKSRLNVLTIVAVLGMLPASKQLVSMIMYLKAHGISDADHEAIKEAVVPLCNSYDNIFTTYEKTYEVPSVVIRNGNVCGYAAKPYKDLKKLEDHITECAKKEGYQINTKIFEKLESYQNRLSTIKELEDAAPEKDLAVREIIHEITL